MASHRKVITKSGAVRWQSRWREPGPGGVRIDRKQNHATEKAAKAHARKMAEEREGKGVGGGKHTLGTYLAHWLAHLERREDHSPTTIAGYARHVKAATHHIGHIALDKLAPLDLDRLYGLLLTEGGAPRQDRKPSRPLSRQTVLHVHRCLHTALKQAVKWRLIGENPAINASPPRVPFKQARGYTAAEIARIIEAAQADPVGYTAVAVLLVTGMRRSELLGLALDAIDFDAGALSIARTVVEVNKRPVLRELTKTAHSRRTLAIPPALVTLLRAQKARVLEAAMTAGAGYSRSPMFLFPAPDGGPMPPMDMTLRLRQFRRRAQVEGVAPTHGWRHSAATLLVAGGADVKTVQGRLGHSTPVITLKLYTDVIDERDRAAGETLGGYLPTPNKAGTGEA